MKLKLSTIHFCILLLINSFCYSQEKNDETYIPNDLTESVKYLKKSIHPSIQKDWIGMPQSDIELSFYFQVLDAYINSTWLEIPNSKLLVYMKVNSKRNTNHSNNIVTAFIEYLKNPKMNLQTFLYTKKDVQKFLAPIIVDDISISNNCANYLIKGYQIHKFDNCDDEVPTAFRYIEKNNKIHLINNSFESLSEIAYDGISWYAEANSECRYFKIQLGNKLGILNYKGEIACEPIYDCIDFTSNGIFVRQDSLWSRLLINPESKEIENVGFQYEDMRNYTINRNGEEISVIPCECKSAEILNVDYTEDKLKTALVDVNSQSEIFPPSYEANYIGYSDYFDKREVVSFRKNNKKGILDFVNNNVMIPFEYEDFENAVRINTKGVLELLIKAKKDGKWGLISPKNETILSFKYDRVQDGDFSTKLDKKIISCSINKKWGYVDVNGNVIIPFVYELPMYFTRDKNQQEFFICSKDSKYGLVDYSNKIIIPFAHKSAMEVAEIISK